MLRAHLTGSRGQFHYDVELQTGEASVTVLVGASGAGKTTVLHLLAGLARADRGFITHGETRYFDADARLFVPNRRRPVGYVLQDGALFPHLTGEQNVAFGLVAQGMSRRAARRQASELLERLGFPELGPRQPSSLSGGERQRVAVARALVLKPELLLLDEPFAGVDRKTASSLRLELRSIIDDAECTTILVTHSPFEAMAFGDRIAVIEDGRVQQTGSRDELLRHPRSEYVAYLMGLNFFRGSIIHRLEDGITTVSVAGGNLKLMTGEAAATEVIATVDPRDITLHPTAPVGTAQNVFRGTIREITPEPPHGERVRVVLATQPVLVAEISAHAATSLALQVGDEIYASFKATRARVFV